MAQEIHQPLELISLLNARELGGYLTTDGHTIRMHRFLRTAGTDQLTEEDRAFLYDYGVRCVIDLRSTYETNDHPSKLDGYRDIAYYHVPMLDEMNSKKAKELQKDMPTSMFEIYQGLILDSQAAFKRVLDIIADHPDHCILFHCTAGKDRTGLTAMLLLSIAKVDEETIVQDYAVSEKFLSAFIEKRTQELEAVGIHPPKFMFGTEPENMIKTLALIREKFGSVHDYLLQIGVDQNQMEKIRKTMLE